MRVIYEELSKELKFDYTAKCHIHKPETMLEKERHKIIWDVKMQTDPVIPLRRPDLVLFNKKENLPNSEICCLHGSQRKKIKENEKRNKYLDLVSELKSNGQEGDSVTYCNWSALNDPQTIGKKVGRFENQRTVSQ